MNAGVGLHREHDLVDRAEDLVDLAHSGIFVHVDRRVEIGDLRVRQLAHEVALAVVARLDRAPAPAPAGRGTRASHPAAPKKLPQAIWDEHEAFKKRVEAYCG